MFDIEILFAYGKPQIKQGIQAIGLIVTIEQDGTPFCKSSQRFEAVPDAIAEQYAEAVDGTIKQLQAVFDDKCQVAQKDEKREIGFTKTDRRTVLTVEQYYLDLLDEFNEIAYAIANEKAFQEPLGAATVARRSRLLRLKEKAATIKPHSTPFGSGGATEGEKHVSVDPPPPPAPGKRGRRRRR